MDINEIAIPYGAYWSTPFARWQGSLAHLHSLTFAAHVAKDALRRAFDRTHGVRPRGARAHRAAARLVLRVAVADGRRSARPHVAGPTINQACATGVRVLQSAAAEIREGNATTCLAIAADRTSNGPHLYYPAPDAPGGTGEHENWILDNFNRDPMRASR